MNEEQRKYRILIIHEDVSGLKTLVGSLENKDFEVTVVPDTTMSLSQPHFQIYNLVLLSGDISTSTPTQFIRELKETPLTSMVPVVVMLKEESGSWSRQTELIMDGAEAIVPKNMDVAGITKFVTKLLDKHAAERLDPVTGLVTGAHLTSILENLCTDAPTDWHFLGVKLLGIQSYNISHGYDAGDNMLRDIADLLVDIMKEMRDEVDLVGRIGGSNLCIVTRTRMVESLCRSIKIKSERRIRRHYTAFELMKGYITVEDGPHAGDYHLCEAIVAAVQVPRKWDTNSAYLIDITNELLRIVEKEESDYRIIST